MALVGCLWPSRHQAPRLQLRQQGSRARRRGCAAQGTAATEAEEFYSQYGLRVITVPPHRPCMRVDHEMRVYLRRWVKKGELDRLIADSAWRRQPVLIGTGSVVESDEISGWLSSWRAAPPAKLALRRPPAGQVAGIGFAEHRALAAQHCEPNLW